MNIRRRTFLAGAAGALAARAAAAAKWKMRLSTSSVMFNSLPVEEACTLIAAAGYEAVDLWEGDPSAKHLDEAFDRLEPKGLKALLPRRASSSVPSPASSPASTGTPKCSAWPARARPLHPGITILRRCNRGIGRDSPHIPVRSPLADAFADRNLKPSLDLADKYNYQIAIENHSAAMLNLVDSFKVFLELASHPRLRIALAPYHLQRDHIPVEDVIAVAGPRIRFLYAWQNEPETRQLPGVGSTDFTPWLKALAPVDYPGYVNPFMHEALKAASGQDRPPLSPAEMSEAIIAARRYLEQCRRTSLRSTANESQ